jgi:hypothetical protein
VSAGIGLPITTGKTVPASTSRTNSPAVAPDTNGKETTELDDKMADGDLLSGVVNICDPIEQARFQQHIALLSEAEFADLVARTRGSNRIGLAKDDILTFYPHGAFVYLLWGEDENTPLYVGQSQNVLSRLGRHLQEQRKRSLVKRVDLIRCSSKKHMQMTEIRLIWQYKPPLNQQVSLPIDWTG